jgi:hypothetical protein
MASGAGADNESVARHQGELGLSGMEGEISPPSLRQRQRQRQPEVKSLRMRLVLHRSSCHSGKERGRRLHRCTQAPLGCFLEMA